jgi:hypothetical protein
VRQWKVLTVLGRWDIHYCVFIDLSKWDENVKNTAIRIAQGMLYWFSFVKTQGFARW